MQAVTLSDLQDIDDVLYARDAVLHTQNMHVFSDSINDLLDQDSLEIDVAYLLLGVVIACIMTQI